MQVMICQKCGADCPPGTSFCRQCGAPVDTGAIRASEQTTALLEQNDGVTTQRLESRETGPDRGRLPRTAEAQVAPKSASRRSLVIGVLVVVIIGLLTTIAVIAIRSDSASSDNLIYPGSKVVLDMNTNDGGRVLQLETTDSFNDVQAWYQKALHTEKFVRLTPTNVVFKNDKIVATLASDGTKTNVLIKTSK